jgi:hypothetical protein
MGLAGQLGEGRFEHPVQAALQAGKSMEREYLLIIRRRLLKKTLKAGDVWPISIRHTALVLYWVWRVRMTATGSA